nr:hypothetical protein [Tanacetum cinerariifolium]
MPPPSVPASWPAHAAKPEVGLRAGWVLGGVYLRSAVLLAIAPQQSARPTLPANSLPAHPVWQSAAYTVYADEVIQEPHHALARSATELTSDYHSPASAFQNAQVAFKFSLNGKDNELPPGQDNLFLAVPPPGGGPLETPVITFGQRYVDPAPAPAGTYLAPSTRLKIRLDMRPVLAAFEQQGYYTTYKGDKLYKQDFKQVFVAGNTAPLSWDFDNL